MIYRLIYCSNNFIILATSAAMKATASTHQSKPMQSKATAKPNHQLRHTGQLMNTCTHSHRVSIVLYVNFRNQVKMYSELTINAALTATKIQTEKIKMLIILIFLFSIYFYFADSSFLSPCFACP